MVRIVEFDPAHCDGARVLCLWCNAAFEPRASGGSPQRFCSALCRRAFDTACRKYAAAEVEAGRLQVSALRMALRQRARCSESRLGLRATPGAPKAPTRPDGALRVVADNVA